MAPPVLATLVFVGLASAVALGIDQRDGIVVPLRKRNPRSLQHEGVIIPSALARAAERIEIKYTQGNAAYKKNTGKSLFAGLDKPLVKRQTEPLTDERDELWVGTIGIGTPAQSFAIDFDTGSADLWVPGIRCTSGECSPHKKYDPSASSTSAERSGSFSISYADGTSASGPIYSDTVTVAGLPATDQSFSPVDTESGSFSSNPSDGIMGMAFSTVSSIKAPTFIENLYSQGKINSPGFSMKLASSGSELCIGCKNSALYIGPIYFSPLTSKTYWLTTGSAAANDQMGYDGGMIIDSGTTLIAGSSESVASFWQVAGGEACPEPICGRDGFYTFPCAQPPVVAFVFGGNSFSMSPESLSVGATDNTGTTCVGAITALSNAPDAWIVGDAFMRNYYCVFDGGQSQVGFAKLA